MSEKNGLITINLPDELIKEIEEIINNNSKWASKSEFVADAVNQLIKYHEDTVEQKKNIP